VVRRAYANTICPYCEATLVPLPKAKHRCPACGRPIWVRAGPDGLTYLLQESDLAVLDQAWAEHREAQARAQAATLNRQAEQATREILRTYAVRGIVAVEIAGGADPCPPCRSMLGRRFQISDAPPIPIAGCTSETCRCGYLPVGASPG
jgi:hypothetical protein